MIIHLSWLAYGIAMICLSFSVIMPIYLWKQSKLENKNKREKHN